MKTHSFLSLIFVIIFLISGHVFAADMPIRWAQIDEDSYIVHTPEDAKDPANKNAAKIPFTNFVSDIFFDPEMLDKSSILFSATFHPASEAESDDNTFSGAFQSTDIRQIRGNQFQANGKMMLGTGEKRLSFPFTIGFVPNSETPRLVIEGYFEIQPASHASAKEMPKYPNLVPIQFRIVAEPLPQ